MAPTRLLLSGPSIEELSAQLLAEHGPAARIIAAERVTVGGIAGFFARRHYELTVELPVPARRGAHVLIDGRARAGIAALLDDADSAEASLHGEVVERSLSTGSNEFAALMDDLTFNGLTKTRSRSPVAVPSSSVAPPVAFVPVPAYAPMLTPVPTLEPTSVPTLEPTSRTAAAPPRVAFHRPAPAPPASRVAPALPTKPGDLVVVVGLGNDAVRVARSMVASSVTAVLRTAGDAAAERTARAEDRRSALAARAAGVERGAVTFVACGWDAGTPTILAALQADQVWVAVDAGRKPADTARWVQTVTAVCTVTAVAVEAAASTASPETVNELGLPVGWIDGLPVARSAS